MRRQHRLDTWICQPASDPPAEEPHDAPWCGDPDGELHKRFEANDATVVMIRPDRYVGTRCTLAEADAALASYLLRVFG